MADLLYELAYEVNTSALDKAEARLKRYDDAMARSSERARRLERDISSIGGGRSSGTGVIRSSGASAGRGGSLLTSNEREIQRNMRAELRARERIDRTNDQIGQREWRRQLQIGREQRRQAADLERFNARRERAAVREATQAERERRRIFAFQERMRRQREREQAAAARTAAGRFSMAGDIAGGAGLALAGAGAGVLALGGAGLALAMRGGDYAVNAFGERSSTLRGYTTFLGGDRKQAELEFYRAQEFAQKTDFTSSDVEKGQARLMAQGFRGQDLYRALFAASDLASAMPGDKSLTLERTTTALGQIKSKGKLQGEELTGQLAEAGLNVAMVRDEIRNALGLKTDAEVQKRISSGGVSADVALPAIERAILRQLNTSKLGEFSVAGAGSVTSLQSNRDEAFKNLLKSFDADDALPAMKRYKEALTAQNAALSVTSTTGKNAALVLQDMSNQMLHAKAGWSEFSTGFLQSFTDSYAATLRSLDPGAIQGTAGALESLGQAIGRVGSFAARAMHWLDGLGTKIDELTSTVEERAERRQRGYAKQAAEKASAEAQAEQQAYARANAFLSGQGIAPMNFGDSSTLGALTGSASAPSGLMALTTSGSGGFQRAIGPPVSAAPVARAARRRVSAAIAAAVGGGGGAGGGGGSGGGTDMSSHIGTQVNVTQNVTFTQRPGETLPAFFERAMEDLAEQAFMRVIGRRARRPIV